MTNTIDWDKELQAHRGQYDSLAQLISDLERDRRALVLSSRIGDEVTKKKAGKDLAGLDEKLRDARSELADLHIVLELGEQRQREAAQEAARADAARRNAEIKTLSEKRQKALGKVEKALADAGRYAAEAEECAVQISATAHQPRLDDQPLGAGRFQTYMSREIRRHLQQFLTPDAGKPDPWRADGYPKLSESTATEHLEFLADEDMERVA